MGLPIHYIIINIAISQQHIQKAGNWVEIAFKSEINGCNICIKLKYSLYTVNSYEDQSELTTPTELGNKGVEAKNL